MQALDGFEHPITILRLYAVLFEKSRLIAMAMYLQQDQDASSIMEHQEGCIVDVC